MHEHLVRARMPLTTLDVQVPAGSMGHHVQGIPGVDCKACWLHSMHAGAVLTYLRCSSRCWRAGKLSQMLAAEHALDTACMMHSSCVLGVLLSEGAASCRNKLLPSAGLRGKTTAQTTLMQTICARVASRPHRALPVRTVPCTGTAGKASMPLLHFLSPCLRPAGLSERCQ